jgi:hypothetical protein
MVATSRQDSVIDADQSVPDDQVDRTDPGDPPQNRRALRSRTPRPQPKASIRVVDPPPGVTTKKGYAWTLPVGPVPPPSFGEEADEVDEDVDNTAARRSGEGLLSPAQVVFSDRGRSGRRPREETSGQTHAGLVPAQRARLDEPAHTDSEPERAMSPTPPFRPDPVPVPNAASGSRTLSRTRDKGKGREKRVTISDGTLGRIRPGQSNPTATTDPASGLPPSLRPRSSVPGAASAAPPSILSRHTSFTSVRSDPQVLRPDAIHDPLRSAGPSSEGYLSNPATAAPAAVPTARALPSWQGAAIPAPAPVLPAASAWHDTLAPVSQPRVPLIPPQAPSLFPYGPPEPLRPGSSRPARKGRKRRDSDGSSSSAGTDAEADVWAEMANPRLQPHPASIAHYIQSNRYPKVVFLSVC